MIVVISIIADMIGVNIGDEVTFIDGDDISYKFKVDDIMKNYVGLYICYLVPFSVKSLKK